MTGGWSRVGGSARGWVRRLEPSTRIVCGVAGLTTVLIAPLDCAWGTGLAASTVLLWLLFVAPAGRVVRSGLLFGSVAIAPYAALSLAGLLPGGPGSWCGGGQIAWVVYSRGLLTVLVSVGLWASLAPAELHAGLARLTAPPSIRLLLLQIVHQTGALAGETRQIAAAMAVRRGTSGLRTALALIAGLPRVWLPRIIDRAERVGALMELREYDTVSLHGQRLLPRRARERVIIVVAAIPVGAAVALRLLPGGA